MKNLLVYVHPAQCFDYEHETLVKIQIDNSLDLGWDRKDILLATNFQYEHNGVQSLVVSDDHYCRFEPTVAKMNVVLELFERDLIGDDQYWLHDFDAYQQEPFTEAIEGEFALTDYGRLERWSTGSIFFRKSAANIFEGIYDICYEHRTNEERALWVLTGHTTRREAGVEEWISAGSGSLNDRINKLNITYNFPPQALHKCYGTVTKPIKVSHFHLMKKWIDFFIHGQNELEVPLVPKRLIRIFNQHGVA